MPYIKLTINWNIPITNSRNDLRKYVVLKFMEENPGKGSGELTSRYKYIVKEFSDGRKLYLLRPARFKYGFDFQIWMERWNKKKKDKMPSYEDIVQDLKLKKKENELYFKILLKVIDKVFICEEDDRISNFWKNRNISFSDGEDIEVLMQVIKWMFIEQDIRYWNFSGRSKLKNYIDECF